MSTAFQPTGFQSDAFQILAGSGETPVEVPNVVGQTQADGTSAIEAVGLVVVVETRPSNQPAGTIVEQQPAGGTFVLPGSTVTIYVSAGSSGAGRPRRRERYIARYKGEDYEFSTYEELEEFVQKAQKTEKKKPKRDRKPIRIELTPAFVEIAQEVRSNITPTKYVTLPPSEALKQVWQIEQLVRRRGVDEDDDDDEVLLWLM